MQKKGSLLDVLLIPVIIIVAVLTLVIVWKMVAALDIPGVNLFNRTTEGAQIKAKFDSVSRIWDYSLISVWVILIIVAAVIAYMLRTSPMFLAFSIFIILLLLGASAAISLVWEKIAENSVIASELYRLPWTVAWLNNLTVITFITMGLILFMIYALGGDEQ